MLFLREVFVISYQKHEPSMQIFLFVLTSFTLNILIPLHFIIMQKKIIILFLLVIGVNLYSNNLYACNKPHKSTKATSFLKMTKAKAKSDCCKSYSKDMGHDCNKKCTPHNCSCTSISLNSYVCKKEIVIETALFFTTQRKYNFFKPSFYSHIHISIWHPPKIA